jgi:steroid 5-alpha reductase family enzyme
VAVASLVLGIIAFILSFIPCIGIFAIVPAILGIIFGIVGMSSAKKTGQGKGMAVAGLILSILAIIWVPLFIFVILGGVAAVGSGL